MATGDQRLGGESHVVHDLALEIGARVASQALEGASKVVMEAYADATTAALAAAVHLTTGHAPGDVATEIDRLCMDAIATLMLNDHMLGS